MRAPFARLRLIRSAELDELRADRAELAELRPALTEMEQAVFDTGDSLLRAQDTIELLRKELTAARDDLAHAHGELEILRAQHLLDTEDRVVLRALLRTARRQSARTDRVFVLFHYGRLHSLHSTQDAAESTAEAQGAPRSGWTTTAPGAALPPASEVTWRVQPLRLGGEQQ